MEVRYEDSLFYTINSCSKYFNMLFEQFFKKFNLEISATELLALKVISETPDCSQRDLARIILKDRANTGKLALSLEKKGLITIELKRKNNRPIKMLTITKKGQELHFKAMKISEPVLNKIHEGISKEVLQNTIETIKNFRAIVEKSVEINI